MTPATAIVEIRTASPQEAIDVTDRLAPAVAGWPDGVVLVSIDHTSAALILGPGDDGMLADFARVAQGWLAGLRPFQHLESNNPNGEAHVLSSFAGSRLLIEIEHGTLRLGRWQRILLLEFDGPLARTIRVRQIAGGGA